jgi:hypothetical protein
MALCAASFSTSKSTPESSTNTTTTTPVYIHPLSQIVLEHLQNHHADWAQQQGLDQSLQLHSDGTFTLTFPNQQGKLWTSYDVATKKHWLSIEYQKQGQPIAQTGQYMLQDNTKPAWQDDSSKTSLPEKITAAVDTMIDKLQ